MTTTQLTLTGDETDLGLSRSRPQTLIPCPTCGEHVLESRKRDHEHFNRYGDPEGTTYVNTSEPNTTDDSDESDEGSEDDEPELVGGLYSVELSYTVDYVFTIPAWSEDAAEERAKDLTRFGNCADAHKVWSDTSEIGEIFEDDPQVPDDYDPFGSTPLWEVYGDGGDDDDE